MSHFFVLVIGDDVDGQLEPYDENADVEPYLASMSGEWRPALKRAGEYFAEKEPDADRTDWTDQQYLDAYYGDGYWKPSEDGEGFEHWSTYSPQSKWDWYVIGGRWDGTLVTRTGATVNQARIRDVDLSWLEVQGPFAVVKDGQWYQKGQMGWFGMSTDNISDEEWDARVLELIKDLPDDTMLTVVDCHI